MINSFRIRDLEECYLRAITGRIPKAEESMNNAEKHLTRTREEQNQILSLWGRTFFGSSSCQQEPVNILRVCARKEKTSPPQKIFLDKSWGVW